MDKKSIIPIIILIIILGVGVWWVATKYKPPTIKESQDEISVLLTELKDTTEIDFSDIEDVEFNWNTKSGGQDVQGRGFEANRISDTQFRSIGVFFSDKGFEADLYNIAAGTISGMTGYKLALSDTEQIVCHFIGGVAGYKDATDQWIPSEPELRDVEIECGKTEIKEEVLITEEVIKKLFADKYEKKVSAVSLNISKETENYAEGGVMFLDEEGPGNSGLFLAAKIDNNWQLVFDGNGAFACEMLEDYGFPEDMMEQCAEDIASMLDVKNNSVFFIVLESNPTTGYQWQVDYDADYIESIDKKYLSGKPEFVGSGGQDIFKFRALKSGMTEIKFSYLRSWEGESIEEKTYQVIIN